jgi:sulfhydrogenase subunit beta (sulfur reductase)
VKATITKDLIAWLTGLMEDYTLIAPTVMEDNVLYKPVASTDEIAFDFTRTDISPKEYFFPDTQAILSITKGHGEMSLAEPPLEREQVIFGIRPCDARALKVLDALLLEHKPADAYYAERREKTTLIGLACPEMWPGCFCTSLDGAPDNAEDVDVMLTEAEGGYLVQTITKKGEKLADSLALEETSQQLPYPRLSSESVPVPSQEVWRQHFDDEVWARLADRCLSCRVCTYVCPTCRCFDVRDYVTQSGVEGSVIERLRAWDSCLSEGYRRIAGGHNPRPTKMQRLRNRFYCKFHYCPQDFGPVACVGCGRCIVACPVNIDITEMLGDVARIAESQA